MGGGERLTLSSSLAQQEAVSKVPSLGWGLKYRDWMAKAEANRGGIVSET